MSEDLMVQILAMACVVVTLALGVFAVVKIIKAAAVEHDARLDQQQRGQDRLQADAHALGLAVRTERSEHALAPTPKRIAQGSVDGVPLLKSQALPGGCACSRFDHSFKVPAEKAAPAAD